MLFFIVSILGWLVPLILMLVSAMAGTIFLGAGISVIDGLLNPTTSSEG